MGMRVRVLVKRPVSVGVCYRGCVSMRVTMAMVVAVTMIMLVAVRVPSVTMTVRMAAMTVIVSGMSVSKGKQTNHVHQKTKRTNNEKFLHVSQLRALHHAFNSFPDEFDADEHKEDTLSLIHI